LPEHSDEGTCMRSKAFMNGAFEVFGDIFTHVILTTYAQRPGPLDSGIATGAHGRVRCISWLAMSS
jgi:hypothetical protein